MTTSRLDLAWIRNQLLIRNRYFLNDLERLNSLKDASSYEDEKSAFLAKWKIAEIPALEYHKLRMTIPNSEDGNRSEWIKVKKPAGFTSRLLNPVVRSHTTEDHKLTVEIDLRYSDKKISEAIKGDLPYWKNLALQKLRDGVFRDFCRYAEVNRKHRTYDLRWDLEAWTDRLEKMFESLLNEELYRLREGYTDNQGRSPQRLRYPESYRMYLAVWDMRESGLSWNKIAARISFDFGLNAKVQDVRNWHKHADRLIAKGIPGLPPFPSEE